MQQLSHGIAQSIASKGTQLGRAEKAFNVLNSMANGIGFLRISALSATKSTLSGISSFAASTSFAPTLKILSKASPLATKPLQKAAPVAENPIAAAPRASFLTQRRWTKLLSYMGKAEVRYWLAETSHLGEKSVFKQADTGVRYGADRYPTRKFVYDWIGDDVDEDNGGQWRILAIVATGAMAAAGLLLWMIS